MLRIGSRRRGLKFRRVGPIYRPTPSHPGRRTPRKGVTMKSFLYRIFGSATAISALALVLGAPKKWG
jgi:hypothetical protein